MAAITAKIDSKKVLMKEFDEKLTENMPDSIDTIKTLRKACDETLIEEEKFIENLSDSMKKLRKEFDENEGCRRDPFSCSGCVRFEGFEYFDGDYENWYAIFGS